MTGEFVKLVKDMRAAQKAFFKFRRPLDMQTAVQLEKEVDRAIKDFEDVNINDGQQDLF